MHNRRQVVFLFDEETASADAAMVRGGKGANLAEMVALGLPVPAGFTVSTTVARAFRETGVMPVRFQDQLRRAMESVERKSGKKFGDTENPLLVSVRSGAAVSMPGMMDTILNLGLNEETVAGLARKFGDEFAFDCYRRFLACFGEVVFGIAKERFKVWRRNLKKVCDSYRYIIRKETGKEIASDPWHQLELAIAAVFRSWDSPRAIAYRKAAGIPNWWGTAVNVQEMVFGNLGDDSATGVAFSRNTTTGKLGVWGEFLPGAQGEDIVAGSHTPLSLEQMALRDPRCYGELCQTVQMLDKLYKDAVDVEFTIERGKLYILQCRIAKRTPAASAYIAVREVRVGRWTREKALERCPIDQLQRLNARARLAPGTESVVLATGLAASSGAAAGVAVFSPERAIEFARAGKHPILVRDETNPDDFDGMIVSSAVVTATGGATSHAAVVARSFGIPAVVGVTKLVVTGTHAVFAGKSVMEGDELSVDGDSGVVFGGSVRLEGQPMVRETRVLLRWAREAGLIKTRAIDFSHQDNRYDVESLLGNFYLSEMMAHAARTPEIRQVAEMLRDRIHRNLADVFACYLAIAVAGELRHSEPGNWSSAEAKSALDALQASFGIMLFWDRYNAQQRTISQLEAMGGCDHAEFFKLATVAFRHDGWGGSVGGKKWADIAETPFRYLKGEISETAFVDRVFDLQHNGGRLFDKHSMVDGTRERELRESLDRKRRAESPSELVLCLRMTDLNKDVLDLWRQGRVTGDW